MNFFKFFILSVLLVFTFILRVEASTSSGTIDSTSKITRICQDETCSLYGQVNWKPTLNANTTGATAVSITDTAVTGHIWGDQLGWINLAPTGAGVFVSPSTGALSGTAFSSTGSWINFAPSSVSGGTSVGVTIDSDGEFVGFAWVSGAYGGWMKFDCSNAYTCVKTDWRPLSQRGGVDSVTGSTSGKGSTSGSSHGAGLISVDKQITVGEISEVQNVPSFTYSEEKPQALVEYEAKSGIEIVGEMNNKVKKGEFRELFPDNSPVYSLTQDCVLCVVVRRDIVGTTSQTGRVFDRDILKYAFVPKTLEIRIPIHKIALLQRASASPLPDLDGTSSLVTIGGLFVLRKVLVFLFFFIKKSIAR